MTVPYSVDRLITEVEKFLVNECESCAGDKCLCRTELRDSFRAYQEAKAADMEIWHELYKARPRYPL